MAEQSQAVLDVGLANSVQVPLSTPQGRTQVLAGKQHSDVAATQLMRHLQVVAGTSPATVLMLYFPRSW
jgi:hypothetical protein